VTPASFGIITSMASLLTEDDAAEAEAHGIPREEAEAQIGLLARPPSGLRLVRPCGPADGILAILSERQAPLLLAWEKAATDGRLSKFVPSSGAASRMFQSLSAFLDGADAPGGDVRRFLDGLSRFPFEADLLRSAGEAPAGETEPARATRFVKALLSREGLGYAEKPKGLIPFHRAEEGSRTPFDEHLVEAAMIVRDAEGRCRAHFTVPPEWRGEFEARLEQARGWMEPWLDARLDVSFSVQHPSTDTLAADSEGRPFRDSDGRLVFRPGGHGALLRNLQETGGDLVYVKNIDNVVPGPRQPLVVLWKKLLGGTIVTLEERIQGLLRDLRDGRPVALDKALAFVREDLGVEEAAQVLFRPPAEGRAWLRELLDRPLRVAGVVRNEGEPGGGPFWVVGENGHVTRQIVEGSQVDAGDPQQQAIWRSGTHFNPVDLVCSLRDVERRPHDLSRWVDPGTVFISKKSKDGKELRALERPGLWNGAMAGWLTVFVEVPLATFAPVKTVLDLLRPEHQE
jgi:hypothetical protein